MTNKCVKVTSINDESFVHESLGYTEILKNIKVPLYTEFSESLLFTVIVQAGTSFIIITNSHVIKQKKIN